VTVVLTAGLGVGFGVGFSFLRSLKKLAEAPLIAPNVVASNFLVPLPDLIAPSKIFFLAFFIASLELDTVLPSAVLIFFSSEDLSILAASRTPLASLLGLNASNASFFFSANFLSYSLYLAASLVFLTASSVAFNKSNLSYIYSGFIFFNSSLVTGAYKTSSGLTTFGDTIVTILEV